VSDMGTAQRISKLAAARRQLETAIELWFLDKDPVSIHTLAAAAYQIVHDINDKRGKPGELLFDANMIKPELRPVINKALREAMNFFKHADNDPEVIIEFQPGLNLGFLMYSMHGLELLGEPPSDYGYALSTWLALHQPELVMESFRTEIEKRAPIGGFGDLRRMEKREFFKTFLLVRAKARADGLITGDLPGT
jgi:hypothetical protein